MEYTKNNSHNNILGIESSCDDTSAAVLLNDKVLSNVVARQTIHEEYGGVVPELASRAHQQNIVPVVDVALKRARSGKLDELGIENSYGDLTVLAFKSDWFNKLEDVDVVIHLAAYAGVRYSLDHPKLYMDNNIIATQNLISACEKHKVNTVFYASTSCIMANNPLPWNEDEKLGHQSNPYAISKAANESQFKCSKIPINVGLRFFTVYGPWGRPDMALFDFTKNIIAGNPIQLFNNGDMVRDFTYIDDIINGINILFTTLCLIKQLNKSLIFWYNNTSFSRWNT